MTTKRITANRTAYYLIALLVIVIAFLLLGGGPWLRGIMHEVSSINMANLNWTQVIISLIIGFVLGLLAGRRKW
jgi:hypothetical protein